jgi:Fic family protein
MGPSARSRPVRVFAFIYESHCKGEVGMRANLYEIDRKMDLLRNRLDYLHEQHPDFEEKLETSWIYHENALEGVVLTHEEIQAALDNQPVPDISLVPIYEEVRCHKRAIEFVRRSAQRRRFSLNIDLVKKMHGMFFEDGGAKVGGKYRKDMPIHRLYFHEISHPDKIGYRMRQLFEWTETQEARRMHPVKFAATLHYQLMRIYPFSHQSGKLSRLLMNLVVLQHGFLPAIVHAVERQRYYESLRMPAAVSIGLVLESLENAIESTLKLLEAPKEGARAVV